MLEQHEATSNELAFSTIWFDEGLQYFENTSVYSYLFAIQQHPTLSLEEELLYGEQMMKGIDEARHKLIQSNLWVVPATVIPYIKFGLEPADLIQDGNEELFSRIPDYDYRYGVKCSTYLWPFIKRKLIAAYALFENDISVPVYLYELKHFPGNEKGRSKVQPALAKYPVPGVSLSEQIMPNLDITFEDISPADSGSSAEDVFFSYYDQELLMKGLNGLNEPARTILCLKFGVGCDHEMTIQQIAAIYGCTEPNIRYYIKQAISKLQFTVR